MTGKRRDRLLEALGLRQATIVHFDIPRRDPATRWRLHRLLHGRVDRKQVNGSSKGYRYPGLLHEGGQRLGQSVYILPPDLASRLILKLREWRVAHDWREVYVPG